MTHRPALETSKACLERAIAIRETADRLLNQGDEWYVVCYFYSAYHVVRAALLEDPIFEDLGRLTARSAYLTMGDRLATRHQGYLAGGDRVLGINDIVRILYPQIAVEYRRLHSASIDVRYGEGLAVISEESIVDDYHTIVDAYRALRLKA